MKKTIFLSIIVAFVFFDSFAQKINESYRLHIRKTAFPIKIDGVIDEKAWQGTDVAKDFHMVLPLDTGLAVQQSEVRMTYDDKNIYLAATFYNHIKGPYIVESLRRDFSFNNNDNFLLFLDTFNNQTTGFSFGLNAAGAQRDGIMFAGDQIDQNWDTKWISKVTRDEEKWTVEMAIPFKSIRFKKGVKEWGINFGRLDLKANEKSSWTPIPRQFRTSTLAYAGVLVWDDPPPSSGLNFSLIPYVLGEVNGYSDAAVKNETGYSGKVGGDVKLAVTSSLNLDLTINPDFSQVEVDRQIANLDRFELFFPERRQFFLENADLFANFGYRTIRPFFSRRIGLKVPIYAGARLSGNINEQWRIGAMDMQTAPDKEIGLPGQNFGVITLQRKMFSRSSIGMFFINKQSTYYPEDTEEFHEMYAKYNRNVGLEYNLASSNNLWTGKAFVFKSFSSDKSGNGFTQAANINYKSTNWNLGIQEEFVDSTYNAEVGFVPRKGYFRLGLNGGYLFYPDNSVIQSHGPALRGFYFFDQKMKSTDYVNLAQYFVNFLDRSAFRFTFIDEFVELQRPFDPTGSGKPELPAGSQHIWNAVRMSYTSKPKSMFTYAVSGRIGGYYEGGKWHLINTELGYRFQPYVSLKANVNYNYIDMPSPWDITDFWLIGSEIDITFTNKIFFATLFQYNEQSDTFNVNSRFQWRYQPASDIFLVFNSNKMMPPFNEKTWSLTLKVVYWFTK